MMEEQLSDAIADVMMVNRQRRLFVVIAVHCRFERTSLNAAEENERNQN
jgi:hypothetical protein